MDTTQIYTPEALAKLLKEVDLKDLSKQTDIKYGTLKNYAYGQSSIDKMPIWMAQRIIDARSRVDFFNRTGNIFVPQKVFDILKSKLGITNRSTYDEYISAQLLLDNYVTFNYPSDKPYYFFISLHELSQINVDLTLFSLSLAKNIRFVFVDDCKNFQDYVFGKEQISFDGFVALTEPFSFGSQSMYKVIGDDIGRRVSHYKEGGWLRDSIEVSSYAVCDFSYMRPFDLKKMNMCVVTENTYTLFIEYKLHQFLDKGVLSDSLDIRIGAAILNDCLKDYSVFDLMPLFVMEQKQVEHFIQDRLNEKQLDDLLQQDALSALAIRAWRFFYEDCDKYLGFYKGQVDGEYWKDVEPVGREIGSKDCNDKWD